MAYITKEEIAAIRKALKDEFGKRFKFSVRNRDHMVADVSILAGDIDFAEFLDNRDYNKVNHYWLSEKAFEGADVLKRVLDIIKLAPATVENGREWFDKSDAMTDYFHTAFYIDFSVGRWDKPYKYTGE